MKDNGVFAQFDFYRDTTIKLLDSVSSESLADIIPVGFNNSYDGISGIYWLHRKG